VSVAALAQAIDWHVCSFLQNLENSGTSGKETNANPTSFFHFRSCIILLRVRPTAAEFRDSYDCLAIPSPKDYPTVQQ
jgi:hypothetical protein